MPLIDKELERNLEERLWGIGIKSQQALAWRMFDNDEDWQYKGNYRIYEDIEMTSSDEQF